MAVSNQPNIMDELKNSLKKILSEAFLQPTLIAELREIFITEFKRQDEQNGKEQGDKTDENMIDLSTKTRCPTQPHDQESSQSSPTHLIDTRQREHLFHSMASTTILNIKSHKHIQPDHHRPSQTAKTARPDHHRQPDHNRHQRQSRHTDKTNFTARNIHVGSKKKEKHDKYRKPSTRKAKVKYKIIF